MKKITQHYLKPLATILIGVLLGFEISSLITGNTEYLTLLTGITNFTKLRSIQLFFINILYILFILYDTK